MNELNPILSFLIQYGYWLAVPIMILEGPIITIVMGFLASFGFFNIFIVIIFGVVSDLISDFIYYWSGLRGGPKVLSKFKISQLADNGILQKMRQQFQKHPWNFFFGAKVLTGVAHTTFVLAGVTKFGYKRMLKYTIPGGIVWSAGLAVLGYYFGKSAISIQKFLSTSGIILFLLLILFLIYKFWFGKYIARKLVNWNYSRSVISGLTRDPGDKGLDSGSGAGMTGKGDNL